MAIEFLHVVNKRQRFHLFVTGQDKYCSQGLVLSSVRSAQSFCALPVFRGVVGADASYLAVVRLPIEA
jgi:hypothetical protein